MSSRTPNERGPPGHDGASPYKRVRTHSPAGMTYPFDPSRFSAMPAGPGYEHAALYARSPYQGDQRIEDYRSGDQRYTREIDNHPTRQRPRITMLPQSDPQYPPPDRERYEHADSSRNMGGSHPQTRPPQQPSTHPLPGAASAGPGARPDMTPPSHKRPRLAMEPRPDLTQPLRIDTRAEADVKKESLYNPQVEAISPTLPSDDKDEKSSKDELLQNINTMDREIVKLEQQISKLKRKEHQLEEEAKKPPEEKSSTPEPSINLGHQSIAQIIYAENRKKAEAAHAILGKFGAPSDETPAPSGSEMVNDFILGRARDLPLYNQPSDTAVYHENKRRFMTFKKRLVLFFKRRQHARRIRERYLTERYDQMMNTWVKKVERIENGTKRRNRDAKYKEMFEKTFPELRKQREDRERMQTRGIVAKSDADLEQIMDGIHEQEEEDRKMRSYAVIPPMLLDCRQRSLRFLNNNGLIEDPMADYQEAKLCNIWTDAEKEIFKERYLLHPKNFAFCAAALERKSLIECVQYYYMSKKKENYKELLRKQSVKRKKIRIPAGSQATIRAEQEKQEDKTKMEVDEQPVPIIHPEDKKPPVEDKPGGQPFLGSSVPGQGSTDAAQGQGGPSGGGNATATKDGESGKSGTDKGEPTDDDDGNQPGAPGEGGVHQCAVCKSQLEHFGMSRPLNKAHCTLYGISEAGLSPDMRVCSSCRCRLVRRRYTQCPVPTCKTPKRKVKRLRPLPPKLQELPADVRDPILRDMQLTPEINKCCSACFNRIARRMGNNPQTNEPLVPLVPENSDVVETSRWTEDEMQIAMQGLREHGRDWAAISLMVGTKSEAQCKNFYFNYKRKFGLEALVHEHKRNKGDDNRTVSTSESVASTLTAPSEDEPSTDEEDNADDTEEDSGTDTANSACSPAPNMGLAAKKPDPATQEGSQKPPKTEEGAKSEDSKAPESSEEKVEAATSLASLPGPSLTGRERTLSASQGSLKSIADNDSSATLSADEGPPGGAGAGAGAGGQGGGGSAPMVSPSLPGHRPVSHQPPPPPSQPTSQPGPRTATPQPAPAKPGEGPHGGSGGSILAPGVGGTTGGSLVNMVHPQVPAAPPPSSKPADKPPASTTPGPQGDRKSPACVRDLIHSAIERNLQQPDMDLSRDRKPPVDPRTLPAQTLMGGVTTGTPYGAPIQQQDMRRRDLPPHSMPGREPMPHMQRPASHPAESRHAASPYGMGPGMAHAPPHHIPGREAPGGQPHMSQLPPRHLSAGPQDVSRRPPEVNPRSRAPIDRYIGDPRDFEPRDQGRQIGSPPPAHSHHRHQISTGDQHRPHSEPRVRSPVAAHHGPGPERSQATPPSLRPTTSPYTSQQQAVAQQQAAQRTGPARPIGQPPPLINLQDKGKMPPAKEKVSPMVVHSGGSITQGTPVNQPPPSSRGGSISMGTPRYDPTHRQQATPPHSRGEGGSITKGTPIYETDRERGGASRGGPPMPHETGAPRMPGVYDVTSGVRVAMMYPGMMDQWNRQLQHMSQAGAGVPVTTSIYPQAFAQYSAYNSSRDILAGDFMTAQQMHAQEAQRREKDHQLSPRTKEPQASPREPSQSNKQGFPPPGSELPPHLQVGPYGPLAQAGLMYMAHPGQVPGQPPSSSTDRAPSSATGNRASPLSTSSHASRDHTPPRAMEVPPTSLSASWPHAGRTHHPQHSPNVPAPRHPSPSPSQSRSNVIQQSKMHGQMSVIMEPSTHSPRGDARYRPDSTGQPASTSSLDTLVKVAASQPSLVVPGRERPQMSPHPLERRTLMEQDLERERERERERMEREKEREHQERLRRQSAEEHYRYASMQQSQHQYEARLREQMQARERERGQQQQREDRYREERGSHGSQYAPPRSASTDRYERPPEMHRMSLDSKDMRYIDRPPNLRPDHGGSVSSSSQKGEASSGENGHDPSRAAEPHRKDSEDENGGTSGAGGGTGQDKNTLTAAKLIDAIIKHQINRPNPESKGPQPSSSILSQIAQSEAKGPHTSQGECGVSVESSRYVPAPGSTISRPQENSYSHLLNKHMGMPPELQTLPPQEVPRPQPYKPHHKALSRYEAERASEQSASDKSSYSSPGQAQIPNLDDHGTSHGNSPGSDKSTSSSQSAAGRAITLGEHIDAIITQDYHTKHLGPGHPRNGANSAADMNTRRAIKTFLANSNSSSGSTSDGSTESPRAHVSMASGSLGQPIMSSQQARSDRGTMGNHHKHAAPYPLGTGSMDPSRSMTYTPPQASGEHSGNRVSPYTPPQVGADYPGSRPSVYTPPQSGGEHPGSRPSVYTPPQASGEHGAHMSMEQQIRMREEEMARPRSYSSGASRNSPVFQNWKHKKVMEHERQRLQEERDRSGQLTMSGGPPHPHMSGPHSSQSPGSSGHPATPGLSPVPGPSRSPIVLGSDERHIIKVGQQRESARSPAQLDRRYLQPSDRSGGKSPYMDNCSPASSSLDSADASAKPCSPRSPRCSSGSGTPLQDKPVSTLAAAHQTMTSLLSTRPSYYQADSSGGPSGASKVGTSESRTPPSTPAQSQPTTRLGISALDIVKNKIAEFMKAEEPSSQGEGHRHGVPDSQGSNREATAAQPSSSSSADRKRYGVHSTEGHKSPRNESEGSRIWGQGRGGQGESRASSSGQGDEGYGEVSGSVHRTTPSQSPGYSLERPGHSPHGAPEPYPHSPRTGHVQSSGDSRMLSVIAESSTGQAGQGRSPKTQHCLSSSSDASHMIGSSENTSADSGQAKYKGLAAAQSSAAAADSPTSQSVDSPQSDHMVIDESGDADSSANPDTYPSSTPAQSTVSTSRGQSQGDIHNSRSPRPSDAADSSHGQRPHQPAPSDCTGPSSSTQSNVSSSSAPYSTNSRYTYSTMSVPTSTQGASNGSTNTSQEASPVASPRGGGPGTPRDSGPSPLLSSQYETLSDDDED